MPARSPRVFPSRTVCRACAEIARTYRHEWCLLGKGNWSAAVFLTDALPIFEMISDFIAADEQFLQGAGGAGTKRH
jgi:hypothetical protein